MTQPFGHIGSSIPSRSSGAQNAIQRANETSAERFSWVSLARMGSLAFTLLMLAVST